MRCRSLLRTGSEKGIVLVLTLMILAIITAMVVEFAYGVYTTTSALYNWRDSQRLSFVAKSGTAVAVNLISSYSNPLIGNDLYKYLGRQIPLENVSEGFKGRLIIEADDENSKLNLNSINRIELDGTRQSYEAFKRLLRFLGLDETIADRVAYWIDPSKEPGLANTENVTKNGFMESVDELLLIKGIDRKTYEKLLPYVTVYSYSGPNNMLDPSINVNTAAIPVIIAVANISKTTAETLVNQRDLKPFSSVGEAANIGINLSPEFFTAAPPKNFRITSIGEENKIRRVIGSVIRIDAGNKILYWQEM